MRSIIFAFLFICSMTGCVPEAPNLPEMKPTEGIQTKGGEALGQLNTVLEVYLPPDYKNTYYFVKPITDHTGLASTGEIPVDITSMIREAISQLYYKVRLVERFDETDIAHMQAEGAFAATKKFGLMGTGITRPNPDFRIEGGISQFDRALTSTSNEVDADGDFGGGKGYTSVSGTAGTTDRLSRLTISFNVYNKIGISVPGKYSASMEVHFAKNGLDLGFSIGGYTLSLGAASTAMHGRHLALQMLSEVVAIKIVGRTLGLPYWRAFPENTIFSEDKLVINDWKNQYVGLIKDGLLIPFMQAQCIANGELISVTGVLDEQTLSAFERLAQKFGVSDYSEPNWKLYYALESNRILDTAVAHRAWAAYNAFKAGVIPVATPKATPAQQKPARTSSSAPSKPNTKKASPKPAAPAPSSLDYDSALEGLL